MPTTVLGFDIGGANLKAATTDGQAISVSFPLWKHPDRLGEELATIAAQFTGISTFAITMTGELCDCYSSKEEGVNRILDCVESISAGKTVKVWSTAGRFVNVKEARKNTLDVAASNWHALATMVGQDLTQDAALLFDIGSTTTDIIPLKNGLPNTMGLTDPARLAHGELVYTGVRRTPVFALLPEVSAAELFATTLDIFLVRGEIPEDETDTDTADNRAATVPLALARLARVKCHDTSTATEAEIRSIADEAYAVLVRRLSESVSKLGKDAQTVVVSGSGEFLANAVAKATLPQAKILSLTQKLGPALSSAAPAYAVAKLFSGMDL